VAAVTARRSGRDGGEVATPRSPSFSNALALLFPIDWPELLGLVMAEASVWMRLRAARPVPAIAYGLTGLDRRE
jgi:hypothetical protein